METARNTSVIRDLRTLREQDMDFAGSKGARLGELIEAGLPVPPGFVVGAPAFRSFLDASGLRGPILERCRGLDVNDPVALKSASVHIRSEVNLAEIPRELQEAVVASYRDMGSPAVAVRASNTFRSTATVSHAGFNETALGVAGSQALLNEIRHCWSSLFTDRNLHDAVSSGRSPLATEMAVVVQHQIDAAKAGMMISVDPVSGMTDRVVIEATLGLGAAVAGGSVSPDRYVIDKDSGSILSRQVRHKEIVVEKDPADGDMIRRLAPDEQDASVLSDLEVQLLVELALKSERFLEGPQSLEWAVDGENVTWILQARPAPSVRPKEPSRSQVDAEASGVLAGECAMPGVVSGRVRVVDTVEEAARFRTDEILVTRNIAPEWTPLIQRASAVVTDSGGMTSHAATVARELEIPCVVGTGTATSRLKSGDLVMVDATGGVIIPT